MKIALIFFMLLMLSCNSSNHVVEIKDVGRDTTFYSEDHAAYRTCIFLKITGNIDDTAFVNGIALPPGTVNFSGNPDYYNTDSLIVLYKAYRATKGTLRIEYH